jgi:hypothetical protein
VSRSGRISDVRDEGIPAGALLRRPVRLRGIKLGRPVDLVLDPSPLRAIGVEVLCGDESVRFLPLAAARVREDEIAIGSALLLLQEPDLSFYRRRGTLLSELRGRRVERRGHELGVLRDVVLDRSGAIAEVVVDGDTRVPVDSAVRILEPGRASAA